MSNKFNTSNRRNIIDILMVFIFVLFLGLFYQMNRMDAFLHLSRWANLTPADLPEIVQSLGKEMLPKEKFLIIYDPAEVQSMLTNHNTVTMLHEEKKEAYSASVHYNIDIDESYQGVIIATGNLKKVKVMDKVIKYVENGGNVLITQRLNAENVSPELMTHLGIKSLGNDYSTSGINVKTDFMLGAEGFAFDTPAYNNDITQVELLPSAKIHLTSYSGVPLVWQQADGKGSFWLFNGRERDDKNHRGLMTALISQLQTDYIYPVINAKLFFIDDFPAPVPAGHLDRLYEEVHLDTEQFFDMMWWPNMQENAKKYNLKYTGLIIETYGNQVEGPFEPLPGKSARNNLIVYGRELLNGGGELGIHGYNHQSLALEGHIKHEIGYTPWKSKKDMVDSLKELHRYISEVYPGYTFQTYVPPSNILSKEGHEAVKEAFPDLKVYASLFTGLASEDQYFQDFSRNDDGTYEIPRISAGHNPPPVTKWEIYNLINYKGVFSHFLHPDELFYEESKDLTWAIMKDGLDKLLKETQQRYGWLQPVTASECAVKLDDYLNMDYRLERKNDGIKIYVWDYRQPVSFVLRTHKNIGRVEGGSAEKIQADAYIITVNKPAADIFWQQEE